MTAIRYVSRVLFAIRHETTIQVVAVNISVEGQAKIRGHGQNIEQKRSPNAEHTCVIRAKFCSLDNLMNNALSTQFKIGAGKPKIDNGFDLTIKQ